MLKLEANDYFAKEGLVKSIGVCNFKEEHLNESLLKQV